MTSEELRPGDVVKVKERELFGQEPRFLWNEPVTWDLQDHSKCPVGSFSRGEVGIVLDRNDCHSEHVRMKCVLVMCPRGAGWIPLSFLEKVSQGCGGG